MEENTLQERVIDDGPIKRIHKYSYKTKKINGKEILINPQDKMRFVNENSTDQSARGSVFGYYPPFDWDYTRKDVKQLKKDFRKFSEFEWGYLSYKCPWCGDWSFNPTSGMVHTYSYMESENKEVRTIVNVPCPDNCQLPGFLQNLPSKYDSIFERLMAFFYFHGIRHYKGWMNRIVPLCWLFMGMYNLFSGIYNRKSRRLRNS